MSEQLLPSGDSLSPSLAARIDEVCDRFENAWKAGQRPRIEDHLDDMPEAERSLLLRELLTVELQYRCRSGETLVVEDYRKRFPEHINLVAEVFREAVASF